jgi:hypothetical protein
MFGWLATVAWIVFFAFNFRKAWLSIVETHTQFCVAGSTPADLVAKRLDERIPRSVHYDALAEQAVADEGFRKLTRNEQVAVLEYLDVSDSPLVVASVRGNDEASIDDKTAERELAKRLGPRPSGEQRHNPHDPAPLAEHEQFETDEEWAAGKPFDPKATNIDIAQCEHHVFHPFRLLTLSAGLLVGSVIAFTGLLGLLAGVDWVVAGFKIDE